MDIQLGINLCDIHLAALSTVTTGSNLQFYNVVTGGTVLDPMGVLVAGDYFVSKLKTVVKGMMLSVNLLTNAIPTFTAPR
jgi:hypothetical protein